MNCAVIFGGTGFIGSFFAQKLLSTNGFSRVYVVDREPASEKKSAYRRTSLQSTGIIEISWDVRSEIDWFPEETVELIANFAAVHREPGHEDFEYYETNILGAENVCQWAEKTNCPDIIFTSSISPYGPSEVEKDETSLPCPTTAYGGSKLVAEHIHKTWLAGAPENRNLVIVRPGVVFGPGEGGNVSRLVKAVLGRYFFYMGNRQTRKAGTYVKELCAAMLWILQKQKESKINLTLFNMSMNPGPSIQEYVEATCEVAEVKRNIFGIPYTILLMAAHGIDLIARPLRISHPFSPVRIRKLVRSNNIKPTKLVELGYPYQYTLKSAFADWKLDCPEEWC
ncbi:nucleoside-diphosphate-sugar epimerase [Pseudomonas citronellolis]|uniref:NAD-dependent epimerase/dehydratase family protein n=1 Tax=Pseudomonas citronellolis TaxID=53408 RepID=UPI0020A21ABA|nr:NAD(P)-dependent oxidoreductase [Pseudomonas citronellolis]MCP1641858.1 nucleoside-diphosphate-sugar epimerase [Pseudomonas citronellolis]MCP1664776.1 nucleoside-diphosphate-sugar epimerase [Pseudomonas citronellolis]MCP1695765.1 nucleoside-diphosphate-sugar epimerase [Pseudomonas citronellolis]MCP1702612.1 nucleoside-diphosphate-sugar epimerase [Pseudomonas citronellolis]MCP1796497.1 nucleoside-diphosphate-sugar epimerase [Pseudomonas citronellolis]